MTRISLESFVQTARLSNEGDVRMARGSENGLVNKGTLGNRLVSFFENIGRKIGILRPDPTRAERQQHALEDFTQALKSRYGEHVAGQALSRTGLDQSGVSLTGRNILAATEQARQLVQQLEQAMPSLGGELDNIIEGFRDSEEFKQSRFEHPAFAATIGARLERLHEDSGVPLGELYRNMRDVLRERQDIDQLGWRAIDRELARLERQAISSGD